MTSHSAFPSTSAVTYVDDLIGQILDALVQTGLADNTIVTLIGDHGWTLGENGVSITQVPKSQTQMGQKKVGARKKCMGCNIRSLEMVLLIIVGPLR